MQRNDFIKMLLKNIEPPLTDDFQLERYSDTERNELEEQAKKHHNAAKRADEKFLLHHTTGNIYAAQIAYTDALKYYNDAYQIYIKSHEPSVDAAHFYMDLANFYRTSNEYSALNEAIRLYKKAAAIYENAGPNSSIFLLQAILNLGITYNQRGECKKDTCKNYINAIFYFEQAIHLGLFMFGPAHEHTAQCHHLLGYLYEKIAQEDNGLFDESIAKSRFNYQNAICCYRALGKTKEIHVIQSALARLSETEQALYFQSIASVMPMTSVQTAFFAKNNFGHLFWVAPVNENQLLTHPNDKCEAQQSQAKITFSRGKGN